MRSEVNNSDFLVVLFQFFVSTLISISRNSNLKQIVNYIKPSSFNFMITISYVFYCNNCYEMLQILTYVFIYLPIWENNLILFGAVSRDPVSELLELFLGASSLGDLEHIEAHRPLQVQGTHTCPLWQCPQSRCPWSRGKGTETCSSGISGSSCTFGCSEGSLQMTMVPCISIPDRICPWMETLPVKGRFLSM